MEAAGSTYTKSRAAKDSGKRSAIQLQPSSYVLFFLTGDEFVAPRLAIRKAHLYLLHPIALGYSNHRVALGVRCIHSKPERVVQRVRFVRSRDTVEAQGSSGELSICFNQVESELHAVRIRTPRARPNAAELEPLPCRNLSAVAQKQLWRRRR